MTQANKQRKMVLNEIGIVHSNDEKMEYSIEIHEKYRPALKELEKFTHVNVFWWGHENDNLEKRAITQISKLPPFYGKSAPTMGVFATRSEYRPNPILLTSAKIIRIDHKTGMIYIPYFDGFEGSSVVDLKPYLPMTDLHITANYPKYLQHWPKNNEEAAEWWAKQDSQ